VRLVGLNRLQRAERWQEHDRRFYDCGCVRQESGYAVVKGAQEQRAFMAPVRRDGGCGCARAGTLERVAVDEGVGAALNPRQVHVLWRQ
jgi:hypothetical protein